MKRNEGRSFASNHVSQATREQQRFQDALIGVFVWGCLPILAGAFIVGGISLLINGIRSAL